MQYRKVSVQLLAIIFLITGLSISCSFFGAKKLVTVFSKDPTLVSYDTLTTPIKNEIAAINQQIEEARATKWKGTTTVNSQRTIETLTKQKLILTERLTALENRSDVKNETIESLHIQNVSLSASNFALITLLFER